MRRHWEARRYDDPWLMAALIEVIARTLFVLIGVVGYGFLIVLGCVGYGLI